MVHLRAEFHTKMLTCKVREHNCLSDSGTKRIEMDSNGMLLNRQSLFDFVRNHGKKCHSGCFLGKLPSQFSLKRSNAELTASKKARDNLRYRTKVSADTHYLENMTANWQQYDLLYEVLSTEMTPSSFQ
jgi:hypothetical protein